MTAAQVGKTRLGTKHTQGRRTGGRRVGTVTTGEKKSAPVVCVPRGYSGVGSVLRTPKDSASHHVKATYLYGLPGCHASHPFRRDGGRWPPVATPGPQSTADRGRSHVAHHSLEAVDQSRRDALDLRACSSLTNPPVPPRKRRRWQGPEVTGYVLITEGKSWGERGEVPIVRHPHAPPKGTLTCNAGLRTQIITTCIRTITWGGADDEAFGRWAAQITYHIPTHC